MSRRRGWGTEGSQPSRRRRSGSLRAAGRAPGGWPQTQWLKGVLVTGPISAPMAFPMMNCQRRARKLPSPRNFGALRTEIWHSRCVLDRFDLALLNLVQRDDSQTADDLARRVTLSPSAIARRLRRLRRDGWIGRTIALLGDRLTDHRMRAIVVVQLSEHADQQGKAALLDRIRAAPEVQFCYELTGSWDLLLLFDCAGLAEFNELAERVLVVDSTVHRYETSFVKRQLKFEPFVPLD